MNVSLYGINRYISQLFDSTFLVAQMVKNLPAVQETWVQPLGWKDPQEKGRATHSNILAWKIPWTEEPGSQRVGVLCDVCGVPSL